MKTAVRFNPLTAIRRLGVAMLFSAAMAVSVAGAHADPLVTPQWLNEHLADTDLVVLDIRSAIDGGGAQAYAAKGKPNNGGTKIFSVSGDVECPGNYEIPLGTPFSTLLELAGGMRGGRKIKAVIPGGSSAPVIRGDVMLDISMDYDAIAKAGSMLGSGAVIVMDETRCMVKSLLRLSYFYYEESCGQCTPCREGTGWMYRMVERIEDGHGRPEDLDVLNSVADNIQGRTICALGDAAAMPVRAFIKNYREEFEYHIEHRQCLVPAYV